LTLRKKRKATRDSQSNNNNNPNQLNPKHQKPQARSKNQQKFIEAIENYDLTICNGYSGSGKTMISIGMGMHFLRNHDYERVIISRPVIEAGENLGFLPGSAEDKLAPYVQPLLDELLNFASHAEIAEYKKSQRLMMVPFGFMRGRTFKNSLIIADECQNITYDQMKMLLTRMGEGSKMILIGDFNQSDLRRNQRGAFQYTFALFNNMEDVAAVTLDSLDDIQRHPIVAKIEKDWDLGLDNFKQYGTMGLTPGTYVIGNPEDKNVLYD
jgi:phosphate starvation-inducible PhoH-like protein